MKTSRSVDNQVVDELVAPGSHQDVEGVKPLSVDEDSWIHIFRNVPEEQFIAFYQYKIFNLKKGVAKITNIDLFLFTVQPQCTTGSDTKYLNF